MDTSTDKVKPYTFPKFRCKSCSDIIYSKYEGHFAMCSCYENKADNKGIAVDYTRHYGRHIGDPNSFESVTE